MSFHRASGFARANEALRGMNCRLDQETMYGSILSVILTENAAQMGAVDAAAFGYESNGGCLRIIGATTQGKAVRSVPDHPFGDPSRPCCETDMPLWSKLVPGEVQVSHINSCPDETLPSSLERWHRSHKHTLVFRAALSIGEERIGWLGVSFDGDVEATDTLKEAFRSLSQQVTLAVQLTRLSKSANENVANMAVIDERNRIARDMHDTLAHSFTGILMQLEAAKEFMDSDRSVLADCLARATLSAREGLHQSRHAVMALQETQPDVLTKSLPGLITSCGDCGKSDAVFRVRGTARALPAEVDRQVFGVCQEAFTNARRYADASRIEILLEFTLAAVVLAVEDNGRGFDLREVADIGFGISGMKKRAERIGARLQITSSRGNGATVRLEWRRTDVDAC